MKSNITKQIKVGESLLKVCLYCTIIGGVIPILFVFLNFIVDFGFSLSYSLIIRMIFLSAVIAGATSISGFYLDNFLVSKGIKKDSLRHKIAIIVTLVVTNGTLLVIFISYKNILTGPNFSFIFGIGNIFAVVIVIVDYNIWKMRKKVLTLKIENKYLKELAQKDIQLEETIKNLIVTQERNEMARELHDSISQGIHGISYSIKSLRKRLNDRSDLANITEILDHLEETTEVTLKELRNMILELKPSSLEKKGLIEALEIHCELFSKRQEIDLNLDLDQIKNLTPEQEFAIYRIVQEALANVQKHSGADLVKLSLKEEDEIVRLIIEDNGRGYNPSKVKKGNGFNNMKARAAKNNGSFDIVSKKGEGLTIKAEFTLFN